MSAMSTMCTIGADNEYTANKMEGIQRMEKDDEYDESHELYAHRMVAI